MRKAPPEVVEADEVAVRKRAQQEGVAIVPGAFIRGERRIFEPHYELSAATRDRIAAIERMDAKLAELEVDEATAVRVYREALAKNAYGTASLEGNRHTLQEVHDLLAAQSDPIDSDPEEREIINFADLMQRIDAIDVPLTVAEMNQLHGVLFKGVLKDAGQLKEHQNYLVLRERGGALSRKAAFVPTPPERVELELQNTLDWFHTSKEPALVRSLIFLQECLAIHPWRDGNGRLSRLVATLMLYHAGMRGIRYATVDYAINHDRHPYYGNLAEADRAQGDFTSWLDYLVGVVHSAYRHAVEAFLFAQALPGNLNERQRAVAEWFAGLALAARARPVKFSVVQGRFKTIPGRTLQLDLKILSDLKVVEAKGVGKGRTYQLNRSRPKK
jgi:Fic family protein